jgi:hypothetical protein
MLDCRKKSVPSISDMLSWCRKVGRGRVRLLWFEGKERSAGFECKPLGRVLLHLLAFLVRC